MSGDHAKKIVIGGEKSATRHGKAPSRESANKKKDGSPSRIRSHKSGEKKKKKMKKVVYYETDSSSPSTSGSDATSVTSKRQERRSIVRSPYAILAFISILHYFPSHWANHRRLTMKIILGGVI
jgi:SRSO17 transposase